MLTHAEPNLARSGVNLDRSGAGCAGAGGNVVAGRGDCWRLPEVSFAWLKGWLRLYGLFSGIHRTAELKAV